MPMRGHESRGLAKLRPIEYFEKSLLFLCQLTRLFITIKKKKHIPDKPFEWITDS